MAVDNKIVFGGVDSSTYNIYISGEGVFNAPKRDVEMITIPGRNGAFVLDNGRFENITVTYPAFTYETSMATFKQNLANFRNALASKKGYQRLTDTFHTDEYRMAAFIDGIEIKPIKYNTASEFTITFDCKPQRWLTSGEETVDIGTWGDTDTAEGSIVTVDNPDGILAVKDLTAEVVAVQSGSGDPSPTNVRPITGFTEAKVYVSPTTQQTDATVYTIDLDGTRYGGTLDVTTGVMTVTHGIKDLGDLNWVYSTGQNNYFYSSSINDFKFIDNNAVNYICSSYASYSVNERYKNGYVFLNSGKQAIIVDDNYTSAAAFKTAVTGQNIVYELATPLTVNLTAQSISLLQGQNNIWSDTGDVTVEYGQDPNKIFNPTLFESGPLLEATGYGVIEFNGYETLLEQKPIGDLVLDGAENYSVNIPVGQGSSPINLNATITVDTSALNIGDPINFMGTKASWTLGLDQWHGTRTFDYVTLYNETGIPATTNIVVNPTKATVTTSFPPISFAFGTASTATHMTGFDYSYDSGHITGSLYQDVTITYDGAQTFTVLVEGAPPSGTSSMTVTFATSEIDAYSSVIVTDPVFIDCDTGEAYSVVDGTVVDANSFVTLGSDLPKLASGSNTVTFDNTITELKVTPRWWKV